MDAFVVRVPASSANLGPGFDCLGLALDRWLSVRVRASDATGVHSACDADLLGGENLVIEAMRVTAERLGRDLPGCELRVSSDIPVARGMGSSAAAIVAGIRATLELLDLPADPALMNDIGGRMEGHADNISASVMGGVTASTLLGETWVAVSVTQRLPWHPILFIPDSHSMTHEARGILPSTVPVSDAVANIGRTALLSHALRDGRADLVLGAMRDTLHQPYRAKIFPHLNPTIDAAIAAGAHGAALSGAGPTVIALADADRAAAVAGAMQEAAMLHGIRGTADVSTVASRGVHILR